TFTARNSSGVAVEDALLCVLDTNGDIKGKGNSPYTYGGIIEDNWIITANKANYLQGRQTYIKNYATLPYSTGFESGLDEYWKIYSSNNYGRIEITTEHDPHTGSKHLTMDSQQAGQYVINEAWLHLNLAGKTRTWFDFKWKEFGDEYHAEDGVYLSDDGGVNFTKVLNLDGSLHTDNTWYLKALNIDDLVSTFGLTLTSDFVIKFQQYDNSPIYGDGFAFDNIRVFSTFSGSGTLTQDETWCGDIYLAGNVTVPVGITLTIADRCQIRAVESDIKLDIDGDVVIGDNVTFTDFKEIFLDHCGDITITNPTFNNTAFKCNLSPLSITGGTFQDSWLVTYGNGLDMDDVIFNNSKVIVIVGYTEDGATITNCKFYNAEDYAINLWNCFNSDIYNNTFEDCSRNIVLEHCAHVFIVNNKINQNGGTSGDAISIYQTYTHMFDNQIKNAQYGLYVSGESQWSMLSLGSSWQKVRNCAWPISF
ncbi:MAG: right-handed parallel beta-helix repeat-containing protein, partial [Candidatus Cloacimonetes bacterium]|nr:right-handed parallel beta-helix repeat-containing protein [Candidatus Cloacimonadota bacterium]